MPTRPLRSNRRPSAEEHDALTARVTEIERHLVIIDSEAVPRLTRLITLLEEPRLAPEEVAAVREFVGGLRGATDGQVDLLAQLAVASGLYRGRPRPTVRREFERAIGVG